MAQLFPPLDRCPQTLKTSNKMMVPMGSIVQRSVPTNLKLFPNCCSHAHALSQDRSKDVRVGSKWFSTLYTLSPSFHILGFVHTASVCNPDFSHTMIQGGGNSGEMQPPGLGIRRLAILCRLRFETIKKQLGASHPKTLQAHRGLLLALSGPVTSGWDRCII